MTKFFYIREPSKNTLCKQSEELLKRLVDSGHLNKSAMLQELKRHRGNPVACVAYEIKENGLVRYSTCSLFGGKKDGYFGYLISPDTFSKERAKKITTARLKNKYHELSVPKDHGSLQIMRSILSNVINDSEVPQRTKRAAKYMMNLSDKILIAE